jgi:hypothetical protein
MKKAKRAEGNKKKCGGGSGHGLSIKNIFLEKNIRILAKNSPKSPIFARKCNKKNLLCAKNCEKKYEFCQKMAKILFST